MTRPLTVKPVPVRFAWEIVRDALPELVSVTVCEPLLPTATEPKATVAGLAPSWPCAPVPERAIVVGEFGALLTIEIVPVADPPVIGENCAVNEVDLPAARVKGVVKPLMLNPEPEADA